MVDILDFASIVTWRNELWSKSLSVYQKVTRLSSVSPTATLHLQAKTTLTISRMC